MHRELVAIDQHAFDCDDAVDRHRRLADVLDLDPLVRKRSQQDLLARDARIGDGAGVKGRAWSHALMKGTRGWVVIEIETAADGAGARSG